MLMVETSVANLSAGAVSPEAKAIRLPIMESPVNRAGGGTSWLRDDVLDAEMLHDR